MLDCFLNPRDCTGNASESSLGPVIFNAVSTDNLHIHLVIGKIQTDIVYNMGHAQVLKSLVMVTLIQHLHWIASEYLATNNDQ